MRLLLLVKEYVVMLYVMLHSLTHTAESESEWYYDQTGWAASSQVSAFTLGYFLSV